MSTSKIIHLHVTEEEIQALDNQAHEMHELGLDNFGPTALVTKVIDRISDAYYNG